MIVVDSSALIAILFDEPEGRAFTTILTSEERCVMSAVNVHETACVLRARHGAAALSRLWRLLAVCEIEIASFDEAQMRVAIDAFDRFGKGVHSKARLNLAGCAAYALAVSLNAPLLFKGNDFPETDVQIYMSER
ncbi:MULTISPECIES: type II toxin-antitoxin system VapC family toxin [Methylosinus]|uniref:PIN domain nuclease n=1 Tax=Methylosinus trichosporium (strain ATCC 35070 / NCIMB 11131 / UNIQEM 75 / OB3b) TaxID=595536 RepID=A0A2D2D1A8_METT3|nr:MULTISPECIES: type II toxin-antitoxin system VapC family toxin [Methylosinus]ATQ68760.1 PIN domain nuclease [Methylosinus trichosporium OB3b]OBS53078.1 twitching motility protein PilT [Methylosinus sp. 3S-1]